jgi:hypothetical protein
MARVLIGCEFSGVVRDAFAARGHDAWSCDLLPSERIGKHYQEDVLLHLGDGWDLFIVHPPCTFLAVSGARWWKDRQSQQEEALQFVQDLMDAPVPKIALENPVGRISTAIRKPDQIVQPWMFGEGFMKTTCLWLKNLPPLVPTQIVSGREQQCWKMPPSPTRGRDRSRTYKGIADGMAEQWGKLL